MHQCKIFAFGAAIWNCLRWYGIKFFQKRSIRTDYCLLTVFNGSQTFVIQLAFFEVCLWIVVVNGKETGNTLSGNLLRKNWKNIPARNNCFVSPHLLERGVFGEIR